MHGSMQTQLNIVGHSHLLPAVSSHSAQGATLAATATADPELLPA